MNQQTKRIIQISALVVFTLAIGTLLFIVFFLPFFSGTDTGNTANENLNTTPTNSSGGTLPTTNTATNLNTNAVANTNTAVNTNTEPTDDGLDDIADGGPLRATRLTDTYTQGAVLAGDGAGVVYYDRSRQRFIYQGLDGNIALLSERTFPDVVTVDWSPQRDAVIMEFPDGRTIYYHFAQDRQVSLSREVTELSFSPDGSLIAYKYLGSSESQRWLATSSPDGSNQQIVELLGYNDESVQVSWSPDGQFLGFLDETTDAGAEEIFPLGRFGENFPSFQSPGIHFEGSWLLSGAYLLFSAVDDTDFLPSLWLADVQGDRIGVNMESLGLVTWSNKCALASEDRIFCGIPSKTLDIGAGLYPDLAAGVADDVWAIDVANGRSYLIATPIDPESSATLSVTSPFLSRDAATLYFLDGSTRRLYRLTLSE